MGERQQLPVHALVPMTTFGQMTPYGQFRFGPFELRAGSRPPPPGRDARGSYQKGGGR